MDEVLVDANGMVLNIVNKLHTLLGSIGDDEQPKHVKKAAQDYRNVLEEFSSYPSKGSSLHYMKLTLELIQSAQAVAIGITYLVKSLPSELINEANRIIRLCVNARENIENEVGIEELKESVQDNKVIMDTKKFKSSEHSLFLLEERLLKAKKEHSMHDQHIKSSLVENETRIKELNENSDKLATSIYEQLEKVNELYADTLTSIDAKQEQIDDILGHVSGRAISGDYESNSSDERKIANALRYGSLTCMFFIVLIVAYSFWETTQASFKWEQSIFRVALAAILSVPAAYLARESAKHREQQYNHLQTSLNLKTLSPYIASLPEPEQHRIKAEVAQRLFSSKDFSRVTDDSYPLNTHELIMELLKKIDLKK
ncbi:hypothetical protein BH582_19380 [Vibrio sp. 10N.222.47.A9]|uniref:hypothetical protein n=1 Tax=Vibrio sp. 10N.222.47.A9 TaxID=1903178 RepID=UPI00097618D7|nr:hypothetical protein [Vibrio sp. 10N.222.47.A9]OMO28280.1 hypothetical protein BH582_19380 [Vibrio sp. 10N.222.47.A9]